jgi:hypothetical protein
MVINWPFSRTYKHKGKDGTIRIGHKNVDDAIPLSVRDREGSVAAGVGAKELATAKANAKHASKIKGLLFDLP